MLLAIQDRRIVAKVADFGLAVSLITRTVIGRVVENPVWLAPEIMENREYAQPADIYSFGVILYEIAARQDFFGNQRFMAALEVDIIAGRRPELPSDTPAMFAEVVQVAWATDPDDRPPIHDIVYRVRNTIVLFWP